ncbi:hypothetical protein [Ruegeria arenilitoris]|uniref:hypothetical protein n=1 Tax=Ruegeria arenilitoris TaxID=1173585 RepID=UPI0020C52D28|nr:hypothetical protein [Ruegeria arenilitoris]
MRIHLLAALLAATSVSAQQDPAQTLITNVDVFDGVNDGGIENANVLIEGNLIAAVSTDPIAAEGATVIDGGGRTLIPGLIDVHWHTLYCCSPQSSVVTDDILGVAIRGALGSEGTLMRVLPASVMLAAVPSPSRR